MAGEAPRNPKPLSDEDIVTRKNMSRRSLLAATGLSLVGSTAVIMAGTRSARASDTKTAGDVGGGGRADRNPPDGRKDND